MTQGTPNPHAMPFQTFMEEVWSDKMVPTEDGGVYLSHPYGVEFYREWCDAIKSARKLGGRVTGHTKLDGEWAYLYTFPGGERVVIGKDGCHLAPAKQRTYRARK